MKLKVYHPRVLLLLLVLVGVLSTSAMLFANQRAELSTSSLALPAAPFATSLSEEDKEDIVSIVKASGVVKSINGDQDWKADSIYRAKIAGKEGARLEAKWSDPVESSGPWSLVHCQGTIKMFTTERWTQVTRLVVFVDMEDRSVLGFGVTSDLEDDPQPNFDAPGPDDHVKIYDAETGDIVYEGSVSEVPAKVEVCAEGTYYLD